jgi:hypothetical protein
VRHVQRRGTVRAELASLSDKLEVVVHDVQAEPAVASQYDLGGALPVILIEPVSDADSPRTGAIRFLGLPAGYEFSTLIADIVDVASGKVGLVDLSRGPTPFWG